MRRNFNLSFERQKTVLILSGTGTNAWHHYGFLKNFSLEDFNKNFKCITHREEAGGDGLGDLYIADGTNSGPLPVGEVAASGGFPRRVGKMHLCEPEPVGGMYLSDFDFAPRELKSRLKSYLSEHFAESQIVYLSLFKSGQKGNVHWVRTGTDRFPLAGQLLDAALMAMGIPNPRHASVYRRSFP